MMSEVDTNGGSERWAELPSANELRRVGPYELLGVLRGELTSVVYLARQLRDERPVRLAVVEVFDATMDPEGVESFQALGRMRLVAKHRGLANVERAGEDQELHFIASEFGLGETMPTLYGMEMPEPLIASIVAELAEACAELATVRDPLAPEHHITPSLEGERIIVGYDGRARLTELRCASRPADPAAQVQALATMASRLLASDDRDGPLAALVDTALGGQDPATPAALAEALRALVGQTDENTDAGLPRFMETSFAGPSAERQHACKEALREAFDQITVLPLLGAEPLVAHEFVRPEWLLDKGSEVFADVPLPRGQSSCADVPIDEPKAQISEAIHDPSSDGEAVRDTEPTTDEREALDETIGRDTEPTTDEGEAIDETIGRDTEPTTEEHEALDDEIGPGPADDAVTSFEFEVGEDSTSEIPVVEEPETAFDFSVADDEHQLPSAAHPELAPVATIPAPRVSVSVSAPSPTRALIKLMFVAAAAGLLAEYLLWWFVAV